MPAPTWWRFTLTFNTPAFVGGATPGRVDEDLPLRPASVRGALRHWLRLGLADVLGGAEEGGARRGRALADLRTLERALFGGVHGGAPTRSRVLLKPPRGGQVQVFSSPPPRNSGQAYMGYGLFERIQQNLPVTAIRPGSPIALTLGLAPHPRDTEAQREAAEGALAAALFLWSRLGGLGGRSRRGWGSFELTPEGPLPEPWQALFTWPGPDAAGRPERHAGPPANRGVLLNAILGGVDASLALLRAFARAFGAELPARPQPLPELRSLRGLINLRALAAYHPKAIGAIEQAGGLYMDFRSAVRRKSRGQPPLPDLANVRRALETGRASGTVGRAAFGLPLTLRFPSLRNREARVLPMPPGKRAPAGRMPGPLLFRVALTARGYVMLLIHLEEGRPPIAGCDLALEEGRRLKLRLPPPDGDLVMKFLDEAVKRSKEGR